MTDDERKRQKHLVGVLKERINAIPRLAISGSYQDAINFKAWVKQANKLSGHTNPNLSDLSSCLNAYERFK